MIHVQVSCFSCTMILTSMFFMLLQFLKGLATVTGKDVQTLIEQWVYTSGIPRFYGSFVFNRKRNVVELDLKQDTSRPGTLTYTVSILKMLFMSNQLALCCTVFIVHCTVVDYSHNKNLLLGYLGLLNTVY